MTRGLLTGLSINEVSPRRGIYIRMVGFVDYCPYCWRQTIQKFFNFFSRCYRSRRIVRIANVNQSSFFADPVASRAGHDSRAGLTAPSQPPISRPAHIAPSVETRLGHNERFPGPRNSAAHSRRIAVEPQPITICSRRARWKYAIWSVSESISALGYRLMLRSSFRAATTRGDGPKAFSLWSSLIGRAGDEASSTSSIPSALL